MKQTEKILKLLEQSPNGVTNIQLNEVAFRYSARVADLRGQGHGISATHIKGSTWLFKLNPSICPVCKNKTLHTSIGVCDTCDRNAKWAKEFSPQARLF